MLLKRILYACENCYFLFESDNTDVIQCPDCGKYTVRKATVQEQEEYEQRQREE